MTTTSKLVLVLCVGSLIGADSALRATGRLEHGTRSSAPQACVGKVRETMNSGGYTYVKIDCGDEEIWAAGPQIPVSVGSEVKVSRTSPMRDFHSPTLDRTFETIYFVGSFGSAGEDRGAHGNVALERDANAPSPDSFDLSGIQKAEGGKTVEEVFAQRNELAGKEVLLRGKVVKFNAQVMGKNWIHLRDGTGGPGTNDLTVTTAATVEAGVTVLVRGTAVVDKDFGAGYRYDILLEDAKVTVESPLP